MAFTPLNLPPIRRGTGQLARLAADINMLAAANAELERRTSMLQIQPSPGVRPSMSPGGTTLAVTSPGATAPAARHPFQLVKTVNGSGDAAILVWPGTLDGLSPTISTVALDETPAPTLTAAGGQHVVALEITFEPNVLEDYQTPPEEYLGQGGTVTEVKVVTYPIESWPPDEVLPTPTSDGTFYQRIGYYIAESSAEGILVRTVNNDTVRSSLVSHFCPPETFYLTRI